MGEDMDPEKDIKEVVMELVDVYMFHRLEDIYL